MYLIKNANLISMKDINYKITDILIDEGKIKAIGKIDGKDYPDAVVIDADKRFVTPGIVDPHCHIGVYEEAIGFEGTDVNEMTNPVFPELRAIDAVKPQDVAFRELWKPASPPSVLAPAAPMSSGALSACSRLSVKPLMIWWSSRNHR